MGKPGIGAFDLFKNAVGIARAGSNPAAPTIRRQTATGRFLVFKE